MNIIYSSKFWPALKRFQLGLSILPENCIENIADYIFRQMYNPNFNIRYRISFKFFIRENRDFTQKYLLIALDYK